MFNKVWIGRVAICLLTVIILTTGLLALDTGQTIQSEAPDGTNCVVYNYNREDTDLTPTLYMWNVSDSATYRVYSSQWASAALLGQARPQIQGACCVIPLDAAALRISSGSVYVSRQADGEMESERVAVKCPAAATPSVGLSVYMAPNAAQSGGLLTQSTGSPVSRPNRLREGYYYVVNVSLEHFTYLDSLMLPIKYDPEVLELTKLSTATVNGTVGFRFDGAVSTGESGVYPSQQFMLPSDFGTYAVGGFPAYGIGAYQGLADWGARQQQNSTSEWVQTPYVNTETGLIKLEFSTSNAPADVSQGASSEGIRILRLYFKCLKTPEELTSNWVDADCLHFASEADVPEGVTSLNEQQRYYFITSPHGYTASIQSMDVLAPPVSADAGVVYMLGSGSLTAAQVYSLPQSYSTADEQIRTLIENQVKVYNYTNYSTDGYNRNTLDYPAEDVLILTPSNTVNGAAKPGDLISVYVPEDETELNLKLIGGPTMVDGEGGVAIKLGTTNLDPQGGDVYVSVTRAGKEHAKIAVPYDPELNRDVSFQIHSSGIEVNGGAVGEDFTVKRGDQIRLDLYFNHFDDLLAYTFGLSFDPNIVQAADSSFHALIEDGYISEADVNKKASCLAVGADMSGITLNDEIIYTTWNSYQKNEKTQEEVEEIMAALGIGSWDELERMVNDIKVKYAFDDASLWNGGLLFTGPARAPGTNSAEDPGRTEDSLYPYVNNRTGTLRLASATLVNPPLVLERSGTGYHFLSIYFVAVGSGRPDFSFVNSTAVRNSDGSEIIRPNDGTEVVLSGPGSAYSATSAATVCTMPFTAHWQSYAMDAVEKTAVIKLLNGNAAAEDDDPSALFLYSGYAFRDPGFSLQDAEDAVLVNTAENLCNARVDRYYTNEAGERVKLPQWEKEEAISGYFVIPDGQYSAAYELVYAYTDAGGKTVSVTRNVYVIFRRGDLNGDGEVNLFDEQMLVTGDPVEDELYQSKTYTDQETLHRHLMGQVPLREEYIMPLARSPNPDGPGSTREDACRLELAFYTPDGTKLDPLALPAGGQVILTVRAENLRTLAADGCMNLGLHISYDPRHFALNDFENSEVGDVQLWNETAQSLNNTWIADSLSALPMYTADASDRQTGENSRELYFQYINEMGPDWPIFEDTGDGVCIVAFSFTVKDAFTQEDAICFTWEDYALTAADAEAGHAYGKSALLDGTVPFRKPTPVMTASVTPSGYSITGVVVSYNAKNPITYELYRMGGDGQYETTAKYAGTAVEAMTTGPTAGQHTQDFTITGVESGTYQLVIIKTTHLKFTVSNVVVDNDVDLKTDSRERAQTIVLTAGDLNGDGRVTVADKNIVTNTKNYGISIDSAVNPNADINGDGRITVADKNIITNTKVYGKTEINDTV